MCWPFLRIILRQSQAQIPDSLRPSAKGTLPHPRLELLKGAAGQRQTGPTARGGHLSFSALICLFPSALLPLPPFALCILPTVCLCVCVSFFLWAGSPLPHVLSSPQGWREAGRAGSVCERASQRQSSLPLPLHPLLLLLPHSHTHSLSVIFNVINFPVSLLHSAITCASVTGRALAPRWARPSPLRK